MKKAEYEFVVKLKGDYREPERDDRFGEVYFKWLKEVSEKLEKGDFIGMALDKFFGLPVFEIDNKLYLFWNELYDEITDQTTLQFVKPYESKYWQTTNEFIDGLLD